MANSNYQTNAETKVPDNRIYNQHVEIDLVTIMNGKKLANDNRNVTELWDEYFNDNLRMDEMWPKSVNTFLWTNTNSGIFVTENKDVIDNEMRLVMMKCLINHDFDVLVHEDASARDPNNTDEWFIFNADVDTESN